MVTVNCQAKESQIMTEGNIRKILSASYVVIFIVMVLDVFTPIFPSTAPQLTLEKAIPCLKENSIDGVFFAKGLTSISDLIFSTAGLLSLFFALIYAFNVKFAGLSFIFVFVLNLLSTLFSNIGGAEIYTASDIFFENALSAIGGMICLEVVISQNTKLVAIKD
jgi:hypothetical protein